MATGMNQLVKFISETNQCQNTKGPIMSHTPKLKAQSGAILLESIKRIEARLLYQGQS